MWFRDSQLLAERLSSLVLRDARSSTFDSVLTIVDTFAGVYRCTATNSVGGSSAERKIQG